MHIKVRTMDGLRDTSINLSRLTTVADVKQLIQERMSIEPSLQRLYYKGKRLEDSYKLFDYSVKINEVIQLCVLSNNIPKETPSSVASATVERETAVTSNLDKYHDYEKWEENDLYKVGEPVEVREDGAEQGAWIEAKLVKILKSPYETNFVYFISYDDDDSATSEPTEVSEGNVRPRSWQPIKWNAVKVGMTALVNYNVEDARHRGYWYDMLVTGTQSKRARQTITGTLYLGVAEVPMNDVTVDFAFGAFALEPRGPPKKRQQPPSVIPPRQCAPQCRACDDDASRDCKHCGCNVCRGKNSPETQVMCDECDAPFHVGCLTPPLTEVPAGDWYCVKCKNEADIVEAGAALKHSKRRAKMPSSKPGCTRDWGKGMATMGRSNVCTIVPPHHFGPIPGIEVGECWKFRLGVSEAGVHRPPVGGIHGRESIGAYSIALSGGYEDDEDRGDEFVYTGSGGRDLSGNKRVAGQSQDQTLTRLNMALARNCAAPVDAERGAEATDWRRGKPIRVVRNYHAAKHSTYAPSDGNRYDGIYKVVKYFPEVGQAGFKVWRFLMRRDDPAPAPWTAKGRRRIAELGLEMKYPDGYLDAQASKETEEVPAKGKGKGKRKSAAVEPQAGPSSPKKAKAQKHKLSAEVNDLIKKDPNVKLWAECKESLSLGKAKFLSTVMSAFTCICCQEVLLEPVTAPCMHNVCKACLQRSLAAGVASCPNCRHDLGKDFVLAVNKPLSAVLEELFPGYRAGR